MAAKSAHNFTDRVTRIEVQRRKLARGAVYSVNQDGLIIARPRRHAPRNPLGLVFFSFASVLVFKAVVLAAVGPITYAERVSLLSEGNAVEQFGGWVMQADPATQWLAFEGKKVFTGLL